MTFNDLLVKITDNTNYKSLQNNQKEQINALLKNAELYADDLMLSFFRTQDNLLKEQERKIKKGQDWALGTMIFSGGVYPLTKGIINGITDFFTGLVNMLTNTVNNIGKVFEFDGRLGNDFGGFLNELWRDIVYVGADNFLSLGDGLAKGYFSIKNIITQEDSETLNNELSNITNLTKKARNGILGGNQEENVGGDLFGNYNNLKQKDKDFVDSHKFEFTNNFMKDVSNAGKAIKDSLKNVAQYTTLVGWVQEKYGLNDAGEFLDGISESIGRMLPAIIGATLGNQLGLSQEAITFASNGYFFSTTFGGAFEEALEKGATIQEAYDYAVGVASIETLTEQLGGFELGQGLKLGGNAFFNLASSIVSEGIEEVISETTSAGLQYNLDKGNVSNEDFWSRAMFSFLGGAISGGVFGGVSMVAQHYTTYEKNKKLDKELFKLYKEEKNSNQAQQKINKKIDNLLETYNRDLILDNMLVSEGVIKNSETRLQAKKDFLNNSIFGSELIKYNEDTKTFELTEKAKEIKNDVKGYFSGKQGNTIIDDKYAVSKNRDGGLKYSEEVVISTKEDINKLQDIKKKNLINSLLENNRNIVIVNEIKGESNTSAFMGENGVIYVDINEKSANILAYTISHEISHRIKMTNEKGYQKLMDILTSDEIINALNKEQIELLNEDTINQYVEYYAKETNGNVDLVNELIQEEILGNFIEKIITSEKTLEKIFNLSPELVNELGIVSENVLTKVDKKLAKFEKLFIKYGKQATQYKKGSLIQAIVDNVRKNTWVKIKNKMFKISENNVGFFNSNIKGNLEASLEETHYTNEGKTEREYSEFSKNELMHFFELFEIKNIGDNLDNIIDNLIKEYDNIVEYKEIVGTKYAYIHNLFLENKEIFELFDNRVKERINEVYKNAIDNKLIEDNKKIKIVRKVETFRKIFALNYIILSPNYLVDNYLYNTKTYQEKAKEMYVFDNGLGGFVISNDNEVSSFFGNENNLKNAAVKNNELNNIYNNKLSFLNDKEYKYNNRLTSEWGNSFNNYLLYVMNMNNIEPIFTIFKKRKVNDNVEEKEEIKKEKKTKPEKKVVFEKTGVSHLDAIKSLNLHLVYASENYEKLSYLNYVNDNERKLDEIKLSEIKLTKNGEEKVKVIEEIFNRYRSSIYENYKRSELYNHIFSNVAKVILINMKDNFNDTTFIDREKLIEDIYENISNTMEYIDSTFSKNVVNIKNPNNPNGYQYTRLINWGLRDLFKAQNQLDYEDILNNKKLSPLLNLLDSIVDLNITNKDSVEFFLATLKDFHHKTRVAQVNSMALSNEGESAYTIPNVLIQNSLHIDNVLHVLGENRVVANNKGKVKYVKEKGLINIKLFDKFIGSRLDMFAMSNLFGLFMEKSTGKVMQKQIFESQKKQLQVLNFYDQYFEKDGFLKRNYNRIKQMEEKYVEIKNLQDSDGNSVLITESQLVYLRDILLREIIRGRLIDLEYRQGKKSNHFKDEGFIFINGNTHDSKKNQEMRRQVRIVKAIDLFNELDNILENDEFLKKYNEKSLNYYQELYKYENLGNKDITGLELTNDNETIDNLSEEEKEELLEGLNIKDIKNIYTPMRSVGSNKTNTAGAFDINTVIDMGINDGMVMGIQENINPPLIDSINNVIPQYTKGVANFYGLYRIVNDLNILFNKEIELKDKSTITLADKVNKISPYIVPYFEKLLRDMAGYGINTDTTSLNFNKIVGKLRRNFFLATLGFNVKVMATQFATLFNLATVFGGYKKSGSLFMADMFKNLLFSGSKTKAKYLIENSEIYKNRARFSTYEIGEATKQDFLKGKVERIKEFSVKGITLTDNMINRAFFITLVEHGHSNEQALKLTEQAMVRYQSGGLTINKNELLRSENELLRIFTKFLGEPTKTLSNIEESVKHLVIINQFEKNKDVLKEKIENELKEVRAEINTLEKRFNEIENELFKETNEEKKKELAREQKKINNELNTLRRYEEKVERNNKMFMAEVDKVIGKKSQVKKELARRLAGTMMSITWQTLLGIIFNLLRSGGKDKEEEQSVWAYLGEKIGWQFATEIIGYLPFARDVYNLMINHFDANVINDFQAFNNLGINAYQLINDITNGSEFNYTKHLRNISVNLGHALGLPIKNIERLFTTPTNFFLQDLNYSYRYYTGLKTTSKELMTAVKNGDTKLIEKIISIKLNEKHIQFTESVAQEIKRLGKKGEVLNLKKVPDKISIEGVEYIIDKERFNNTYSKATFVVEKLITQNGYQKLNESSKKRLITSVYNYYYNLAKQDTTKVKIYEKDRIYNLNQAYNFFKEKIPYFKKQEQKKGAN